MRILFISWWWPYPANNGSKIRIYNLLRQVAGEHEVNLLSFIEPGEASLDQIAHMETFCHSVATVPRPNPQLNKLKIARGYLSRWPRSMVYTYSGAMDALVKAIAASIPLDIVIASQVDTLRYLPGENIPAIVEEVEVTRLYDHLRRARTLPARFRAHLPVLKIENILRELIRQGVALTVVSQKELDLLAAIATPEAVRIVPNGVDTTMKRPGSEPPQPYTLIYSGSVTYAPNYDAVRYFITEVLPLVRERFPQTRFRVTGSTDDMDTDDLATQPGVDFTGHLAEVDSLIHRSWAAVVPLRQGGGTRLKILEAMALGTPVISTTKGAEGLNARPGIDLLIADSPDAMASAIFDLFEDKQLRRKIAFAARNLVEQQYDWTVIGRRLIDFVEEVAKRQVHGQQSSSAHGSSK